MLSALLLVAFVQVALGCSNTCELRDFNDAARATFGMDCAKLTKKHYKVVGDWDYAYEKLQLNPCNFPMPKQFCPLICGGECRNGPPADPSLIGTYACM